MFQCHFQEPEPTQKETEEKKEVKEDENVDKEKVEEEVKEEHTLVSLLYYHFTIIIAIDSLESIGHG